MIISGRKIARSMRDSIKEDVIELGYTPKVVLLYAGHDPAIETFIRIKQRFAKRIGVELVVKRYEDDVATEKLLSDIDQLVKAEDGKGKRFYDGMIVQLPLPVGVDRQQVLDSVPSHLDIDILGAEAIAQAYERGVFPPVVGAVREVIRRSKVDLSDKKIVVVGNGVLVGKPVSAWLNTLGVDPVVVTKETASTDQIIASADVVISGAGDPWFITPEKIKPGSVLIDAGTSEQAGEVKGDIHPDCGEIASVASLVPGGIGPITVAILFRNLVTILQLEE